MRKDTDGSTYALLAILIAAMFAFGCQIPTQPTDGGDTMVTVTTNVNTGGGPGTGASPSPGTCGPVTEVTNGILGTNGVKNATINVGQELPLDTTPNKNLDQHCNAFRRVLWTTTQSTLVCRINNPESYTPSVVGTAPGGSTCVIRASIENVQANEPITITVRSGAGLQAAGSPPPPTTCHTCIAGFVFHPARRVVQ